MLTRHTTNPTGVTTKADVFDYESVENSESPMGKHVKDGNW